LDLKTAKQTVQIFCVNRELAGDVEGEGDLGVGFMPGILNRPTFKASSISKINIGIEPISTPKIYPERTASSNSMNLNLNENDHPE
jgi:hypothetical protein